MSPQFQVTDKYHIYSNKHTLKVNNLNTVITFSKYGLTLIIVLYFSQCNAEDGVFRKHKFQASLIAFKFFNLN